MTQIPAAMPDGYNVRFRTCKDRIAAMIPPPGTEYETYCTYADLLMLGKDLQVDMPTPIVGEHIDQVILAYGETLVSSVYLICECTARVEADKKVQSRLITPQQKITVPR